MVDEHVPLPSHAVGAAAPAPHPARDARRPPHRGEVGGSAADQPPANFP